MMSIFLTCAFQLSSCYANPFSIAVRYARRRSGYAANVGAGGKLYEALIADSLNSRLPLFKWNTFGYEASHMEYPVDIVLIQVCPFDIDNNFVVAIEVKGDDPFNYGSISLVFLGEELGFGLTTRSKQTPGQIASWQSVFDAGLVSDIHPAFESPVKLDSSIYYREELPFKKNPDMLREDWNLLKDASSWYKSVLSFSLPKTLSTDNPHPFTGSSLIRTHYKEGYNSYIQVQGKGLYHLGEDPFKLGVPLFDLSNCDVKLRMVITLTEAGLQKEEPLKPVRGSVKLSLYIENNNMLQNLETSTYSLDGAEGFSFPSFPPK